jgi:hypothetical protein
MNLMTQDQYGQARGPGNVIHGDPVAENEIDERDTDETKPMTRFQKVASALRGDRVADRDEADPDQPYGTERDEAAMTDTPIYQETEDGRTAAAGDFGPGASRAGEPSAVDTAADDEAARRDYWDEPVAGGTRAGTGAAPASDVAAMDPDVPVDETNPDVPASETVPGSETGSFSDTGSFSETRPDADHPATEPDMFRSNPAVPAAEGQPGAATIADVPADAPAGASVPTAMGAEEPPAAPGPAETTGKHAAVTPADAAAGDAAVGDAAAAGAAPADRDLRPGESTASLGDFSDLTYGNLIPDAAIYTEQWQQVQFKFVDDPHASVTEAADIVAQVTAKLEAAIQERQRAIAERQQAIQEQQRSLRDRWGEGSNADTENLRATLRMYKTFLDQLIGPKA